MRSKIEEYWDKEFGVRNSSYNDMFEICYRFSKLYGVNACFRESPYKLGENEEFLGVYYLVDIDSYVIMYYIR